MRVRPFLWYASRNAVADGKTYKLAFPPLAAGVWPHVAAVLEPGARIDLYRDGLHADSIPMPNTNVTSSSDTVVIGVLGGAGATWRGALDDIRVFSRALSDAEIRTLAGK